MCRLCGERRFFQSLNYSEVLKPGRLPGVPLSRLPFCSDGLFFLVLFFVCGDGWPPPRAPLGPPLKLAFPNLGNFGFSPALTAPDRPTPGIVPLHSPPTSLFFLLFSFPLWFFSFPWVTQRPHLLPRIRTPRGPFGLSTSP